MHAWKPRRYNNWYLWYFRPTILVLQKCSKFERISGFNYSFTTEKGQFIEWMAQLDLRINSIPLKIKTDAPRKKCPYLELFWSAFSRIRTNYGEIYGKMRTRITPNTDTFLRSDDECRCLFKETQYPWKY